MRKPDVKIDDVIKIGDSITSPKALVIRIYSEEEKSNGLVGDIEVVYYQNNLKLVKDDVTWNGLSWCLKGDGIVVDKSKYPGYRQDIFKKIEIKK